MIPILKSFIENNFQEFFIIIPNKIQNFQSSKNQTKPFTLYDIDKDEDFLLFEEF